MMLNDGTKTGMDDKLKRLLIERLLIEVSKYLKQHKENINMSDKNLIVKLCCLG